MANVATTQVRLVFASELHAFNRKPSPVQILAILLGHTDLWSYNVPIHVTLPDDEMNALDIQYGARWNPAGDLERLWERLGHELEAVWVRWFDSGGDHDAILRVDHENPDGMGGTRCRYAFDRIDVVWRPGAFGVSTALPVEVDGATWRVRADGSYLAGNNRSDLCQDSWTTHLATPTTWAGRGGWPGELETPEAAALIAAAQEHALRYECLWRGRVVLRAVRPPRDPDDWEHYSADHWDNCADPAFLAWRRPKK